MLQLLKESVSSQHAERLEQIVIALIGVEISKSFPAADYLLQVKQAHYLPIIPADIVLGIVTIIVDLFA